MPAVRSELENQSYLALLCGAGQLDDGTPVLLHLWLVMMRQPGEYGGNGTITMQGYCTVPAGTRHFSGVLWQGAGICRMCSRTLNPA